MGYVYEAVDQRVNCIVALKETMTSDTAESRSAFEREAALLANLRHRGLPKVMDYFSENEGDFLVMEFIPGKDLAELLDERGGAFPQSKVLRWAEEILSILSYLHSREPPILHRDIKPSNLKLSEDGELFLLDFGLAKGALGQMPTLVTSRSVRGYTAVYAPVEQILGQGTDPRSDLYSVGATLYHLLTGMPPVEAPTRFHAVEDEKPDPLKPIQDLNPSVSPDVASIVLNAMSLSRRQRPASASEMRLALTQAAAEVERQAGETERAESERQKHEEAEAQRAAAEREFANQRRAEAEARARETKPAEEIAEAKPANEAHAAQKTLPAPPPPPVRFTPWADEDEGGEDDGTEEAREREHWSPRFKLLVGAIIIGVIIAAVLPFAWLTKSPDKNSNTALNSQQLVPEQTPLASPPSPSPTPTAVPTPILLEVTRPPANLMQFMSTAPAFSGPAEVMSIDLNYDGTPEFLAQYETAGSLGAPTHVLQRSGDTFREIGGDFERYGFRDLSRSRVVVGPKMTRGFLDIDMDGQQFTFNGRRYKCSKNC